MRMLIGGFHIHNSPKEKCDVIVKGLKELFPEELGVCHCSGVDKYALFYSQWGDMVFYNHTGCVKDLEL